MKKCQLDLTDEQTVHAHKHENLVLDGGWGGWGGGRCLNIKFTLSL